MKLLSALYALFLLLTLQKKAKAQQNMLRVMPFIDPPAHIQSPSEDVREGALLMAEGTSSLVRSVAYDRAVMEFEDGARKLATLIPGLQDALAILKAPKDGSNNNNVISNARKDDDADDDNSSSNNNSNSNNNNSYSNNNSNNNNSSGGDDDKDVTAGKTGDARGLAQDSPCRMQPPTTPPALHDDEPVTADSDRAIRVGDVHEGRLLSPDGYSAVWPGEDGSIMLGKAPISSPEDATTEETLWMTAQKILSSNGRKARKVHDRRTSSTTSLRSAMQKASDGAHQERGNSESVATEKGSDSGAPDNMQQGKEGAPEEKTAEGAPEMPEKKIEEEGVDSGVPEAKKRQRSHPWSPWAFHPYASPAQTMPEMRGEGVPEKKMVENMMEEKIDSGVPERKKRDGVRKLLPWSLIPYSPPAQIMPAMPEETSEEKIVEKIDEGTDAGIPEGKKRKGVRPSWLPWSLGPYRPREQPTPEETSQEKTEAHRTKMKIEMTLDNKACLEVSLDNTCVLRRSGPRSVEFFNRFPFRLRETSEDYRLVATDTGMEVRLHEKVVWGVEMTNHDR